VIFGNGGHFCSIACDPDLGGDINIFYDGIKRRGRHTTFVSFEDSFKKVVGADYDVTTIWYVKQKSCTITEVGKSVPERDTGQSALPTKDKPDDGKQKSPLDENWSWTSATLPEVWNEGDDMDFTYNVMLYKDNTTLVELSPIILRHLNSDKSQWNEMVVRSFIVALDHHMKSFSQSACRTFFLTPAILRANEISPEEAKKKDGKKAATTMRVSLTGLDETRVKEWDSHDSFVFLLNQNLEIDGEFNAHYSVVTVEKAKDGWWGVVTADDVYGSLDVDIWKETVHCIVKHLGVSNRSNVVFDNPSSKRTPKPSPYKWFAKINVMPDDGDYDDDYSCGAYSCDFLLNHYKSLGRIDCKIIPEITSDLMRIRTKSRMIPVLMNLIKELAESYSGDEYTTDVSDTDVAEMKANWEIYNKVCSVSGEVSDDFASENYEEGPEKYSMKNLNLSLLSLPVNVISDVVFECGCPCERPQYSGAPRIQCGFCYMVYHIECFFAYVRHVGGEKITCHRCKKEAGCDTDMLLIPPRRMIPLWSDYRNDGVLVLDFLRCGTQSTIERMNLRKKCVNYFERRYGPTWAFVSPYTDSSDESTKEGPKSGCPECSWSMTVTGCQLKGVETTLTTCGKNTCQSVSHHLCQTKWEHHQYHSDERNGYTRYSCFSLGGRRACILHHPHFQLAFPMGLPSTSEVCADNSSSTALVASKASPSCSAAVDQAIGKESTPIPLDGARDEVVHGSGHEQQLSVLKPKTDRDLYLDDICKMYPDINMRKLSEHMSYYENWASVRMDAALKAYGKVNDMLMNGKLTYDNSTSYDEEEDESDDDDSDGKWRIQKKPPKKKLDEEDKKFFTSLPACYSLFFALDSQDTTWSICPFSKNNKCWQQKYSLEKVLSGYECNSTSFKSDPLRQHVCGAHSDLWCGVGLRMFLEELYPSSFTGERTSTSKKSKKKKSKSIH
jgi:hypothetical protein